MARSVDAARSVSNFRFFAEQGREFEAEIFEMRDATTRVVFKPVGIAGLITPWKLPLYLLSWKVAPALLMGNTVVANPSELTPMTASLLAEVMEEVGLPAGVFNLVHGNGLDAGAPLTSHPDVNLISFTGGTATGRDRTYRSQSAAVPCRLYQSGACSAGESRPAAGLSRRAPALSRG